MPPAVTQLPSHEQHLNLCAKIAHVEVLNRSWLISIEFVIDVSRCLQGDASVPACQMLCVETGHAAIACSCFHTNIALSAC